MTANSQSLKTRSYFGVGAKTEKRKYIIEEAKRKYIIEEAKKALARRNFFAYNNLMAPDFYKEDRQYLKDLSNELQDFYFSDDDVLIINEPPRHGKSRTAGMFAQWVFGQNKDEQIMTGSYNETLSTVFSKHVRNTIMEEKAGSKVVYSDIFPDVKIQQGDGAMNLWSLEEGYNNYLATSPTGTATGFGATLIIIDDLIKNSMEAGNEATLEKHWEWYTNTMLSRLEEGGKIIIIMTRWHTRDLAGRALEHYSKSPKKVRHITMKALQEDGTMLCEDILSKESYLEKVRAMGEDIASANYQQVPINIKGKLYTNGFKTYTELPKDDYGKVALEGIYNYTDTADEGDDNLCSITFGVYKKQAYILDIYYTKEPMEVTEKELARRLYNNNVNLVHIESNNGGKGFARQVQQELWNTLRTNKIVISWFHQSQNKKARIISNASWVMEHIYYPVNYRDKWPEYTKAMNSYQKEGKNLHDDAPDATTGVVEVITEKVRQRNTNYSGKGAR